MKDAFGHGSNRGAGGTFGYRGIGIPVKAQFNHKQILSDRGKVITDTDRAVGDVRSRLKQGNGMKHAFMDGLRKVFG